MAFLDAARDRLDGRSKTDFESRIEAVRAGTIFAHNQKAYNRWKTRVVGQRPNQRGLTGAALEAAVMRVGEIFPGSVVHGQA